MRVPDLISPLAYFPVRGEHAIHRTLGAEVSALVEKRRLDLGRREIHEARLVQHGEHGRALRVAEGDGETVGGAAGVLGLPPSVVGRP
jgi:hypothetical protein